MKKFLAFVASATLAFAAFAGEYADISVSEVKAAIKAKKITLIDVNGSESYAKRHVPTAIDFDAAQKDLAKHLPADKDALIVAYCGGPKCSAYKAAADAAAKLGYKNVKHMAAGISGWVDAGEKTEKAKKKKD